MKDTLAHKGIDTAKATSHSLRYGGATMMAAAGFPQYLIAMYGGWAKESKSLRIYAQPSEEIIERVTGHMHAITERPTSQHFLQNSLVIRNGERRLKADEIRS
jgi:hypothetical protein